MKLMMFLRSIPGAEASFGCRQCDARAHLEGRKHGQTQHSESIEKDNSRLDIMVL